MTHAKVAATHERSLMHVLHMSALRRKSGSLRASERQRAAQALTSYFESKHEAYLSQMPLQSMAVSTRCTTAQPLVTRATARTPRRLKARP